MNDKEMLRDTEKTKLRNNHFHSLLCTVYPQIVVSKVYGHVHLDADQNARIVMPGWDQNKV